MKTKTFTITICGERWKYRILPKPKFKQLHGDNSDAVTETKQKRMDFKPEGVCIGTVRHELFHAYASYLFLNSSNIDKDDYEEIVAEMLEYYWDRMHKQGMQMFENLDGALNGRSKKVRPRKTTNEPTAKKTSSGHNPSADVRSEEIRGVQLAEGNGVESPS